MDFGNHEDTDVIAKEVLVFMAVCINRFWKIPVGYFPIKSIKSDQKKNLIEMCCENIIATGVEVVSITFDGASTNHTACRLLGCDLNYNKNEFVFSLDNMDTKIAVQPDGCHNIKLVRNTLADLSPLKDINGNKIEWRFLNELVKLQEEEGLHLGNKVKKAHVYFKRQKMKVKLAVQVLSRSTADAIDFCREVRYKIIYFKTLIVIYLFYFVSNLGTAFTSI